MSGMFLFLMEKKKMCRTSVIFCVSMPKQWTLIRFFQHPFLLIHLKLSTGREIAGEVPMPLTVSEIRKIFSHFLQNIHHHLRPLICSPGNFQMWKFPYGGLLRKSVSMKGWLNGQMGKSLMISSLLVTVRLLMIFITIAGTL